MAAGIALGVDHGRATGYEGYDAARTGAVVHDRGWRSLIALEGGDVVTFLHGILTNDMRILEPGRACSAAYLTPQGRMIADMDVLRTTTGVLIDAEPEVRETLVQRFDQSIFTEDVRILDRSPDLVSIGVLGPSAAQGLRQIDISNTPDLDNHLSASFGASEVIVLGSRRSGVDGFHLFAPNAVAADLKTRLLNAGTTELGAVAAESLRIEAGVPRFGTDMNSETIPLEAGIEDRAISLTKGCYVGQEVIVRILHRGHGRVAKRLVGLRIDTDTVPAAGTPLAAADKLIGQVTSAVRSPRFGVIGLGYVHRDFTEPGISLRLENEARSGVQVSALPMSG